MSLEGAFVERENSRPIISWHIILSNPQKITNYKVPRIVARFCYHYSKTNRNLPSVMQKTNHTLTRVSDDISSPTRVSDGPIRLWHVSPIKFRHVSLTHPQIPINKSLPKAFKEIPKPSRAQVASEKIQKHSEVQKLCRNQASKPSRTSRTSTSKSKNIPSRIIQTICLDPKVCWNQTQKPPKTLTNHKSTKLYGFKPLKHRRTSTTNL